MAKPKPAPAPAPPSMNAAAAALALARLAHARALEELLGMGPLQVGPALPEQRQSMMRVAQSRLEHAERQFHEATEAEQAKLQKQLDRRRLRETKIPWIDAYALVVGRLALHGPLTARRGARVHAQLERMLGDALGKLGVTAGHTVLAEHATTLEQAIADAQQYWPPPRRPL